MTGLDVTKDLTAWREVLAASDDSIQLAETIAWLGKKHPEIDMPARALFVCSMTSMLASTLSVESVVNDILQSIVRNEDGTEKWEAKWIESERRPLKDKVLHICDSLGFASPFGERAFSIIDEMVDFRARIVHAKLELVEVQHRVDEPLGTIALTRFPEKQSTSNWCTCSWKASTSSGPLTSCQPMKFSTCLAHIACPPMLPATMAVASPWRAAYIPAVRPAGPAPMMTTS